MAETNNPDLELVTHYLGEFLDYARGVCRQDKTVADRARDAALALVAAAREEFQCPSCYWHDGHDPQRWFEEEVQKRKQSLQMVLNHLNRESPLCP